MTENGKPLAVPAGTRFFLRFDDNRWFSATVGCNEMGARMAGLDGGRMKLVDDTFGSTLMLCPELSSSENWFGALLGDEPLMEQAPNRLVLTAGPRRVEFLEHVADTQELLVGPRWTVTAVVKDGQAMPAPRPVEIVFRKDGTFTQGRQGCKEASGDVAYERGTIRMGMWQRGPCPVPDDAPFPPGEGRSTVERDGDIVRLRSADGRGYDLRAS